MREANIISAAIISYHLINSDNEFTRIRGRETARLWRAFTKPLFREPIEFYGTHPLTDLPIIIIFNKPSPGRQNVMSWNPLTECWFYSEDAGLTWQRVADDKWGEFAVKCDALINDPKHNGR